MSLPENIPLPNSSAIPGSRKIKLKKDSSASKKPILASLSEIILEMDKASNESTPVDFDSPVTSDSKSNLVDSVFSNFVAKKLEEVETKRKESGKKSKHKKEKHKKHKHKDKDKDHAKKESETTKNEDNQFSGGFFAKEKFLDPSDAETGDPCVDSDIEHNSEIHKTKKHKKHKKHKEHKHKHKSKDKEKEKSEKELPSKLLSFHEDMVSDPELCEKPRIQQEAANGENITAVNAKKNNPKNVFADKMEKALELKLHSLKENLTKKHKALEDLGKEVTIPEKKIKMMADFTVSEKLKGLRKDSDISSNSQLFVGDLGEIKLPNEKVVKSTKHVTDAKVILKEGSEKCEEEECVLVANNTERTNDATKSGKYTVTWQENG